MAGVGAIALKGAALHEMGLYMPGERPMADLDVLVHESDIPLAIRVLEELRFQESLNCWKHRVFDPDDASRPADLGEHRDNLIKIELHSRIHEILPWRRTDISQWILSEPLQPGVNGYPSKATLLSHLLLHAAGAMAYRALRLLHLHDIALLASRMDEENWNELLSLSESSRALWWAGPPLALTARYFPARIPIRILDAVAAQCPWLLARRTGRQKLTDVSLSFLWIEAFPGIEWCQSPAEALAYITRRLIPNDELRSVRKSLGQSEPALRQDPWAKLSQTRRIFRWLTTKQTRPATLHAVRMALAQSPVSEVSLPSVSVAYRRS
jgi:hypothetical protein